MQKFAGFGKKIRRALALALASAGLFALCACGQAADDYFIEFSLSDAVYVDGTPLSSRERDALEGEIASLLRAVEDEVSADLEGSDVSRVNAAAAGESVAVGEYTQAMLRLAASLYGQTGGAFSPALYPLSDLWGFTPRFEGQYSVPREEPSAAALEEALALSSFESFSFAEGSVVKQTDGAGLDLGGIAKGYMCDVAAAYIREKYAGHEVSCTVTVMSGSVLLGQKQDDETGLGYTASVDNPRSAVTSGAGAGQALFLAGLSDVAVSTSADNYRFYVYEGKIYPHIIDPSDGKPADNGVISVTVLVPLDVPYAAAAADAYSTAGFCMPLTDALAFYERLAEEQGVAAVVITRDFRYYVIGNCSVYGRTEFDGMIGSEGYFSEEVFARAAVVDASDDVPPDARETEYIAAMADRQAR